jgi:hypothetical protein
MDNSQFDRLARALGALRTRRAATALLGGLLAAPILASEDIDARKKKKKKKKKCKPEPTTQTCAGKCGSVKNNCKKAVACSACTPPCTGVQPTGDLQAAIDAAAPGSTLTLCAGTWTVPRSLRIEKSLTLTGAGIDQSILDGGNRTTVLHVTGDITVTLQDLTITRGQSPTNAGGLSTSSDLTLRNVAVTGSRAESGGGIFQGGGTLTLAAGTRVTGNAAIHEFSADGGKGGGIRVLVGSVVLEAGSSVTNNTANIAGGGIWAHAQNAVTLEAGSTVSNNTGGNCTPAVGTCS